MPKNLLTPFRRDLKNDLASGDGDELERDKVSQVLGTEGDTPISSGELPWRTAFGSGIHLLRHRRNDEALAEMARVYARDAIHRWLPGREVTGVKIPFKVVSTFDGEPMRTVALESVDLNVALEGSEFAQPN